MDTGILCVVLDYPLEERELEERSVFLYVSTTGAEVRQSGNQKWT